VNFALAGEELAYIVNQSGSHALFADPALQERVHAIRGRLGASVHATLRGGPEHDVLQWALGGPAEEPDVQVQDEDLLQILYTSTSSTRAGWWSRRGRSRTSSTRTRQ
jgi:fatty-acyl-CoA synthase